MAKQSGFIFQMFQEISSPEELRQVRGMFEKRNFGGAETFMLRRIKRVWDQLIKAISTGYKAKPQEKDWFENRLTV